MSDGIRGRKINRKEAKKCEGGGAISNRVVRQGLSAKVTSKQRPEGVRE